MITKLADLLESSPIFTDGDWVESKDQDPDGDVRLIQLADVGTGSYLNKSARFLTSTKAQELRCTFLNSGDILIARMPDPLGRACIFPGDTKRAVTVVDVCIVRPDPQKVDGRWLMWYLNSDIAKTQMFRLTTGTTRLRISRKNLSRLKVDLPPLPRQTRIAAVLDQVDELRIKRREAIALLDDLAQSIFLDMFGDPVSNPKGIPQAALTEACHCYSGGTPSKSNPEYWRGGLPWFSAKDLKSPNLFSSQDEISPDVPSKSNLKLLPENTVAIVVRGMILAHSFPVSVLRVPATINQDLKALLPKLELEAQFLAYCLRAQKGHALAQVSAAAHGTTRLDAEGLTQIKVLLPSLERQREFARRIDSIEGIKEGHRAHLATLNELFTSLQQRAFSGTLWDHEGEADAA